MLQVSQGAITKYKQMVDRMTNKAKSVIAKADQAVGTAITTSEVGAAAFLFGVAQGKFGGFAFRGIPIDLVAGMGLHVLAFAGYGGKNASHLHAFGDGALASFFNNLGVNVGASIRTPADEASIAKKRSGMKGELSGLKIGRAHV